MCSIDEQLKIIMKGVAEVISYDALKHKLEWSESTGHPLIVKLGLDPTAPNIHLGHTVVLRKIKQLQDLGHKAVLIIGDFTGRIGDPTGKSKTRKQLTNEEIIENAMTYENQIFKILDKDKTEVRFNSEWLSKLSFSEVLTMASKTTVARMLERDDFKNRFETNQSIGVHEFFYPLMQAYDSVELKADIEIGGTDQKFNILMGRALQKDYGLDSQVALFMPILEGTDGVMKMSKSLNNYIGIDEAPSEIYGKLMSIPDELIVRYFALTTDIHPDELEKITVSLKNNSVNPKILKMKLAKQITTLYHDFEAGNLAEENFIAVFQNRQQPNVVSEYDFDDTTSETDLVKLLVTANLVNSNSEARRLITQGGVKLNGNKVNSFKINKLAEGDILQAGKLKFIKIKYKR